MSNDSRLDRMFSVSGLKSAFPSGVCHAEFSLTANLNGHGTAEAQRRLATALEQLIAPTNGKEEE